MRVISRLGIGPLSPDIIEAVYSYAGQNKTPLMLIASKNQVDYDRGYVYHTAEYRQFLEQMKRKYPTATVYICRDHCGPGHNSVFELEDTYRTIDTDIECGFDLIHIDFCFFPGSQDKILRQSRKAIEHIQRKAPKVMLEIGTDENSGTNVEDTARAERQLKYFTSFCQPLFFVLQTGSVIKEDRQEGIFHEDYVKKLAALAQKYNVALKEHNADYLPAASIKLRHNLIGAVNVAPQFGLLQTKLTLFKAALYGIDASEFLDVSYRSRKWEKWLNRNDEHNRLLCSVIAGHYNFKTDAYQRLYHQINRHEPIADVIQQEMHKIFDLYLNNLSRQAEARQRVKQAANAL